MADDMMFPAAPGALAGLNEKQQLLRQQLAQTLALQQRAPMRGYGALGGIGAGLANAARGISGAIVENRDREELKKNAEEQAAARKAIVDAITGNTPAAAPTRIDPLVAASGHGGFMGVASDMSGPAAATQAAHPIPTGQPVQEAGLAQLAALGIHRPPGAPPAQPAQDAPPVPGGAALQAQPMSGLEQLAALSQKHQRAALALMASGDPMLTHAGETLMDRARLEQQMGFQGGQKEQDRDVERQRIANERYQVVPNAFGGGFVRIDKQTGETTMLGSGHAGGGGMASPGTRLGDAQSRLVQDYADRMNPAKAAPDLWEKVQFGKRIEPLIAQALSSKDGVNNQMARELAEAFTSYVKSGGSPAESAVKEMMPPSFTGNVHNFLNFFTNDMSGADRTAWVQQIQQSLAREEPVVIGGIRQILEHNDLGFPQMRSGELAKQREAIMKNLAEQGYLAAPGQPEGPIIQKPGNFDLSSGEPARKVVGGKTYEKRADGWYEVK